MASQTGTSGSDTLYGGTGNDLLDGGVGNDKLYDQASGNDTLLGGAGDDYLSTYTSTGGDSLDGGVGNDTLVGGTGNDTLIGGDGNDDLSGYEGNDSLDGGAGLDTLTGGSGNDLLTGGDGNDKLYDNTSGNDTLLGGIGDDYLSTYGSTGGDSLDGGAGNDTLIGGLGNDQLLGGDGNDSLIGYAGNDSISGGAGDDTLTGSDGNDSIDGGLGADKLYGGTGDDTLIGGEGNDYLYDTSGNNYFDAGLGNDTIYGDAGSDTVIAGDGNDSVYGYAGNDSINGEAGDDYLSGGEGNNSIDGGLGADKLYGGTGDDTLIGGEGNDYLYDTGGNNYFDAGLGSDTIYGDAGSDTVIAGDGNDSVYGYAGNDSINGGAGDDYLSGGEGNDSIDGGLGADKLYGGTGVDAAAYPKTSQNYTIQIDGPCVFVTDIQTDETDKLTGVEILSFAGVVSDLSMFGKVAVDFNALSIQDKSAVLQEQYINLIYQDGEKWSGTSFTYSFAQAPIYYDLSEIPTGESYEFTVLGSYLQNLIIQTFNYLSAALSISFTETTNTQSATFKFAAHNMTDAAGYATRLAGANSGAINISSKYNSNSLGGYGVSTVIHELGHALGLDHTSSRGGITNGAGGGDDPPSLPDYLDRTTLSIMSYAKVVIDDQYAASFSSLDVKALISLYGKRESNQSTTFKLYYDNSLSTAEKKNSLSKIEGGQWDIYAYAPFMIVDNGGVDTIDASNWKGGVKVDLSGWGVGPLNGVTQTWNFNSVTNGTLWSEQEGNSPLITIYPETIIETAIGSSENDIIIGYTAAETLEGRAGDDTIDGGGGNDTIDGGGGIDVAVYASTRANFTLAKTNTGFSVTDTKGTAGVDTLSNIERVKFSDRSLALDVGATQSGGEAQLLLGAVLGKALTALKKPLLGTVIDLFDQGYTMPQLSGALMRLDIWGILANGGNATATNTQIANYLLTTVNRVAPDSVALATAAASLDSEMGASQGNFLSTLALSDANQTHVGLVGLATTGLEYGGV